MKKFENTRIVITGAAGGIGQPLVQSLSEQGAQLLLLGRSQKPLEALAEKYEQSFSVCDATDVQALTQCIVDFHERHQGLNGLVHLPGSILLKPCHLLTDPEWLQTLNTNLNSAFYACRAVVKHMLKQGGSIVLMTTAAAQIGLPNHEAIAAAKSGVIGLMRAMAASYAKNNIRVNCVAPRLTDTPLSKPITSNPKGLEVSLKAHPLGRIGQPKDIANAIEFLLNPENSWISGQVLTVDGGLSSLKSMS